MRGHRVRFRVMIMIMVAWGVTACTPPPAPAPARPESSPPPATVVPPPANAVVDYQLGGAYRPAADVGVVTRDRTAAPAAGAYGICYVNAYQTQPEERDWWDARHPDLLLRRDGRAVDDPDWPGEVLLDNSTASKQAAIAAVVGEWIDGCAAAGYRAVEPDNLDSWTRSHGLLTRAGNLALATLLADRAHRAGLAIAQKNTVELGRAGRDAGFDFAVAEECQVYDECDDYLAVYGDEVIEIEYTDGPTSAFPAACRARGARISVILRDRDVVPRGRPEYVFRHC